MKELSNLIVSEVFYSIQGEGQCVGTPAVFLRLAGCNLLCAGAGWKCDSIEVWKKGHVTKFENVIPEEYVPNLEKGAHLVITGGEPLLHQKAVLHYLDWFQNRYNFAPVIEVETNGTILPSIGLLALVKYWNVSFKLSTVNEPWSKRVNEAALALFESLDNSIYKVVISNAIDVLELLNDFQNLISFKKVVLMPAGETQEQLALTRPLVVEACKAMNFRYSDRVHIVIWNKKTGV